MSVLRKESIQLWPLWVAIGCPLLLIALNCTPIAPDLPFVMIGIPALMFIWACLGISPAILTARWLWRRALLEAAVCAVLPLAIVGVS
jgi:hypothetical protein